MIKERSALDDEFYKGYTLKHKDEYQKNSRIFEAVEKLPKGGVQHIHIDCCLDSEWFFREVAVEDTSYVNLAAKKFKYIPKGASVPEGFVLFRTEREQSPNKQVFDETVRGLFLSLKQKG